jgi:hypothetical protein
MVTFQFYLRPEKERKVRWVGVNNNFFVKKFPADKGSGRWCVVVIQQPFLSLTKFLAKSLHLLMQLPEIVTMVCRIVCLACQEEFLVNNAFDV